MICENLFAICYRFVVTQRNFIRKAGLSFFATRTENFDAAMLLAIIQFLYIGVTTIWMARELKLSLPVWLIFLSIPFVYFLAYLNYRAFAKKREKRRIILDNYNGLSNSRKRAWIIFSILVFIVPIFLIAAIAMN